MGREHICGALIRIPAVPPVRQEVRISPLMPASTPTDFLHCNPDYYNEFLPPASAVSQFAVSAILKFAPHAQHVLDLGCGLGHEVSAMTLEGYTCVGIDVSTEMLEAARAQNPNISFHLADQRSIGHLPKFDVVTSFGSSLLHNRSLEDLRATLSGAAGQLRRGGIIIIELRNSAYWLEREGNDNLRNWYQVTHPDAERPNRKIKRIHVKYDIDHRRSLLLRTYKWQLSDGTVIDERLTQLMIPPGLLIQELELSGFTLLSAFSEPSPADSAKWIEKWPPDDALRGKRLQIVARIRDGHSTADLS